MSHGDACGSDGDWGHDTWDTYSNAYPRIYKHTSLPVTVFEDVEGPATTTRTRVHYSSMPGYISSVDDFYTIKGLANLVVTETSITAYDKSVLVQNEHTVFSWIRVVVANALSNDGATWVELFSKYNSGTYNNQWLVIDLSKWHAYQTPEKGFFYLVEQTPVRIITQDLTQKVVREGYFASYNQPYSKDVWHIMGYGDASKKSKKPETFHYDTCPRAVVFGKLWDVVVNTTDMAFVMGWNDLGRKVVDSAERQDSPLQSFVSAVSAGARFLGQLSTELPASDTSSLTAANGICARDDLVAGKERRAYGGIDAKIASYTSLMDYTVPLAWARAGPTDDEKPSYCWVEGDDISLKTPHYGHPECYMWDWQLMYGGLR
ncbi:hypothetical protein SARC_04633 [Sphaeroforma arctica JP610]|uniref:Phospholipase B-like n=1 Tax=Sphaeroforma arctica JP610 TaxID=667725 RepID=A0A0L0G201_9EUKA|nr:hypothetical protein SARC_04633 [Sphaeroforma arctica JP610]KNC83095.1 hypothetical protein SARC_04633 [Sphaeroforma arctica JP610]|eukprot:XP_014156997.1 hypothetical protein SARC_04633 [Sphaeroforma arctica JP610]